MNELKFTCQTCGQHLLVDAQEAGRKVVCPNCKMQLTIPKAQPDAPSKAGGGARPADPRTAPTPLKAAAHSQRSPDRRPAGPAKPGVVEKPAAAPETATKLKLATEPQPKPPPAPQPRTTVAPETVPSPAPKIEPSPAPKIEPSPAPKIEPSPAPKIEPSPAPQVGAKPATQKEPEQREPQPGAAASPGLKPAAPASSFEERPAESSSPPLQVGVLTAEIKREIVRAVRELIADPARWMPGASEDGKLAYAGKRTQAGMERVQVGSEEATHYSLLGGILLEMQRRNVVTTATGRTEFLDREIPEAIRKVASGSAGDAGQGGGADATDSRLMSVSHAQCLQVLDVLEREYAAKNAAQANSPALRELRGANLDELLARAAKDEAISSTELVRAVHRELTEINRRLAELEKRGGGPQAADSSS